MKPENVCLDARGNCVVVDFGLAVPTGITGMQCSLAGTPTYQAPEVTPNP